MKTKATTKDKRTNHNAGYLPAITIGLDLGDKRHAFCVLDIEARVLEATKIANTPRALEALGKRYPGSRVVMETGTHSPWVAELFSGLGHEVVVGNSRKIPGIHGNERKSDTRDAELLARLGRADIRMLHPVAHNPADCRMEMLLIKQRDMLVRERARLVAFARGSLKSHGLVLKKVSTESFARAFREALAGFRPEVVAMMEPCLAVLEALNGQIGECDRRMAGSIRERHPEALALMAIKGVGEVVALSFVLTVGEPSRFETPRDIGAFLGLVPRRDQSGEVDKELRITKAGNGLMRRLLVNSAHHILGPFGEDSDLRRAGQKIVDRGGRAAKKKAVVAVARKLAVVMLAMLRRGGSYQPSRAPKEAA
jgi:transposase